MTATITITISPDALRALRASRSAALTLVPDASGSSPRATRAATPSASRGRRPRAANSKPGAFRAGSLPAKLVAWAGGRKRPFGVPDLVKKFRIKRGHASMLITYVLKAGAVIRVARGSYVAT